MENNNVNNSQNILKIRDTGKIVNLCFGMLVCLIVFGILIYNAQHPLAYIFAVIVGVTGWIQYLRIKVILNGITLNIKDDLITFPGGGITFNSTEETFANLKQYVKSYSWNISDIMHISTRCDCRTDKKGNVHYSYILSFTGVPGAVDLSFSNVGQRDQLYSFIVSLNEMGVPIVNR